MKVEVLVVDGGVGSGAGGMKVEVLVVGMEVVVRVIAVVLVVELKVGQK